MQFLGEAVLLTFAGGIAGVASGVGAAFAISAFAAWKTDIMPWALLLPFIISILTGIFFGLYPAYGAAKVDSAVALGYD